MTAWYNEIDPYCAEWLRNLIAAGEIPAGDVDERPIEEVSGDEIKNYTQCHFFAGIGGWALAARLAGWRDTDPLWTGSCPCQFASSAARGRNPAPDLWPQWRRIIATARPGVVVGEQVARATRWFDGVCDDMEAMDYACGAAILPACSVAQDHERNRIFFACHADSNREPGRSVDGEMAELPRARGYAGNMASADGIPGGMGEMRAYGNAIVPQVAAEFLMAWQESIA